MASQELNQARWDATNVMRSMMSADEYRNYLLGLASYNICLNGSFMLS